LVLLKNRRTYLGDYHLLVSTQVRVFDAHESKTGTISRKVLLCGALPDVSSHGGPVKHYCEQPSPFFLNSTRHAFGLPDSNSIGMIGG
jgi:hypothetical protein